VIRGQVTGLNVDTPVAGATIQVRHTVHGTVADTDGRYQLRVRPGTVSLIIRAVGYEPITRSVQVNEGESLRVDVELRTRTVPLGQITVEDERRIAGTVHRLSAESAQNAPALGEPDIVRVAAFLPGVSQTSDLTARLNVRGGAADQNQFLLDGVEVYNPRHLVGVFGAFNPWAIESADVYTASFPVTHGKRLSGIIDLKTRAPEDTVTTLGSVSLVSASLVRSQKIGSTSVLIAARRTYLDPVLVALDSEFRYQFFDGNLKVIQPLGGGFAIEGIGFLSRDGLKTLSGGQPEEDTGWGGRLGAMRLRHERGRVRQSLTASWVRSEASIEHRSGLPRADNVLDDRTVDYRLEGPVLGVIGKVGGSVQRYDLNYTWASTLNGDRTIEDIFYPGIPLAVDTTTSRTLAAGYAGVGRPVGSLWLDAGVRTARWVDAGSWAFAPRVRVSMELRPSVELFASGGRYLQYVATGTEGQEDSAGEPLFLLESPEEAWTTTMGATIQLSTAYRLWVEGYGRRFSNLARVDDTPASDLPKINTTDIPLVPKSGRSAGLDLRLEKNRGWLTGQLAYSFLWSQIDQNGEWIASDWSVPHTVNTMVGLQIGESWLFTFAGTLHSGLPYTPVVGRHVEVRPGDVSRYETAFIDGASNSERFAWYRRFDLSLRRSYPTNWGTWKLYVQALNVFNADNSLRVDWRRYYRFGEVDSQGITSSLPVIPSIGVEFRF
jgi:hypothetical protein